MPASADYTGASSYSRSIHKLPVLYLSPNVLLSVSMLITYGQTLIPPHIYEQYVPEPDLMFGNTRLYVFLAAWFLSLWLGYITGERVQKAKSQHRQRPTSNFIPYVAYLPPLLYLFLPVACGLILLIVHLYFVRAIVSSVTSSPLHLLLIGEGYLIKNRMYGFEVPLKTSVFLLGVITWWFYLRWARLKFYMGRKSRACAFLIFTMTCFLLLVTCVITLSRLYLVPWLVGLCVLYVRERSLHLSVSKKPRLWLLTRVALLGVFVVVSASTLAVWRGLASEVGYGVLFTVAEYGPSSVNHLAAVVDNKVLRRELSGFSRETVFSALYSFPLAPRIFGYEQKLVESFKDSFYILDKAGLYGTFNWYSGFGEVWCAIGWLSFLFLWGVGYVLGRTWVLFLRGSLLSTLLYPWFAYSLIMMYGFFLVFRVDALLIVLVAAVLKAYARLFGVMIPRTVR